MPADETTVNAGGKARRAPSFSVSLGLVALAGLAIRLVYFLGYRGNVGLGGDEVFYSFQANTLADGHGFNSFLTGKPAADHPPLTAIVLTPAAWIWHHSLFAQRLTMTLVGTLVIVVIGLLAREIAGTRAGLIAAAIAAVYPGFVIADSVAMSEPIAALCVAATLLFCYRLVNRRGGVTDAVLAGATLGLAVLARAELALLLVLAVLPAVWLCRGAIRHRLLLGSAAVVAFVVVLAPWVAFNLSRFEKPVYVSTNDGTTLAGANCKASYYGPGIGGFDLTCVRPQPRGFDQSVDDAILRERGVRYARKHAGRLPVVVAARIGRTWSVFDPFQTAQFAQAEGRPVAASKVAVVVFWVLALLAIAGAWTLRRRRVTLVPLLATVVAVTLVSAAFNGSIRTREPAEVAFVALAAVAIDAYVARRRGRERDVVPSREQRDHGDDGDGEVADAAQAEAGTSTVS